MVLKNKVAVVTGAAHRVGQSIALALAEAGAHVVVHYFRSAGLVPATLEAIQALGVQALAVPADLTQPEGVAAVFDAAEAGLGGVDVLVNSAANMEPGDVLTLTRDDWQRSLDLNLTAPFFCAQRAALSMRARGGGAIVNIADLAGLHPWAKYPAHSVSKAGLLMATQVLAKALAPDIRVNAIAPGPVIKPDDWSDAHWHTLGQRTLLKRTGSGYDVARAAIFLLEADFITGETLLVDGGRHIA
jgi:pteridine reductase